jgi:hypothetical protein
MLTKERKGEGDWSVQVNEVAREGSRFSFLDIRHGDSITCSHDELKSTWFTSRELVALHDTKESAGDDVR